MFGGLWTQQKLEILSEYLRAYRKIFDRNERARFFETNYVMPSLAQGKYLAASCRGFSKMTRTCLKLKKNFAREAFAGHWKSIHRSTTMSSLRRILENAPSWRR